MSYHRRRREIKSEINIVPFLDVLLVLLLVFMATAPVIMQSVKVDLPESVETEKLTNNISPPVILEVTAEQVYRLSAGGVHHDNLTAQEVTELAKAIFNKDKNTVFLVGGAKTAPYEAIINALNLLRQAGIQSVGLMTAPMDN